MKNKKKLKKAFDIIAIFITILIIFFIIYGLKIGIFRDRMILVEYVKKFGIFAPILFIFIQIVQVVFSVIPGGASCFAGVLAFGPVRGFIYNVIGLIIGSVIAFFLAKKYGLKLINSLFKEEQVNKYLKYIRNNKFEKILFFIILLPCLPDDLVCYVAGLSNITFKKFLIIIILGKPLGLLIYSVLVGIL